MKQLQKKLFKHSIIAALVISLGGISGASFAETTVTQTMTTAATASTATTSADDHAARKARWEEFKAKREQERTQHLTEMFQQADTNHDGQLTLEEFLAFRPHHHHGFWQRFAFWRHHGFKHHCDEHRGDRHQGFENHFQALDTNHDGSISLSEAQASAPEIAKHFNEIDTDHNGQISQDELHAFFKAQHEKPQS